MSASTLPAKNNFIALDTAQLAAIEAYVALLKLKNYFTATLLFEGRTDITSIKELLSHTSIRTTMIYTHVSKKHLSKIQSPLKKLVSEPTKRLVILTASVTLIP